MKTKEEEIYTLISSLKTWDGQQVLISKDENGDRDQTVMKLNDISVKNRGDTIDDYVAPAALQLKGEGRALMEDTDVPIPAGTYDIPLDQLYDAHFDGMRLYVSTDRGSYTISRI
ncbi:MAG TPA: hypothetical protein VFJ73_01495 [Bacillales bacterium]|nr:hypothetical protein [Bacillales bacterium]